MTMWTITIVLAAVVGWLTYYLIHLARRTDDLASRVDNLEAWVSPQKKREQREHQRERLRADIEQGFRDGIVVPPEVLREAYPDTYPPDEKSKPPDDSSV
jgi:hypothetical protein